jgi:hypothetical protein
VCEEPLPRDETGKLLRSVLRSRLWDSANGFAASPLSGRDPV